MARKARRPLRRAAYLRALGAERVLEQVIAGEQLELVVLDRGAEDDEEGVEERERPQPPDDDLWEEVGQVVEWMGLWRRRRRQRAASRTCPMSAVASTPYARFSSWNQPQKVESRYQQSSVENPSSARVVA